MLTILGRPDRASGFCDGLTRRGFLSIGGAAVGGLTLSQLLQLEAQAGVGRSHKAIINVYLPGGPPHLDMWDLKPDAPAEIRGEFNPIKTNVPGIEICELFPQARHDDGQVRHHPLARDSDGDHDAYQCMTGRKKATGRRRAAGPPAGAWVSQAARAGQPGRARPRGLMYHTGNRTWGDPGDGGFLGMGHAPFHLVGGKDRGMKSDNMVLQGHHARPAARPRRACARRSTASAARPTRAARWTASTRSRTRRWASSRRRSWPTRSTCRRKTRKIVERYGVDDPELRARRRAADGRATSASPAAWSRPAPASSR